MWGRCAQLPEAASPHFLVCLPTSEVRGGQVLGRHRCCWAGAKVRAEQPVPVTRPRPVAPDMGPVGPIAKGPSPALRVLGRSSPRARREGVSQQSPDLGRG